MTPPKLVAQAAALCFLDNKILLVTSKNGSRWVLPKGHLEDQDASTAARAKAEAWEEAGVKGNVQKQSLGRYLYQKTGKICYVEVHRLDDVRLAESWPEQGQRTRRLFSPAEAIEHVREEGLKEIFRQFL